MTNSSWQNNITGGKICFGLWFQSMLLGKPDGPGCSVNWRTMAEPLQVMANHLADRATEQRARHNPQKPTYVTWALIPPAKSLALKRFPRLLHDTTNWGTIVQKGTYGKHFRFRIYNALPSFNTTLKSKVKVFFEAQGKLLIMSLYNIRKLHSSNM